MHSQGPVTTPSGDEILTRVETTNNQRELMLTGYAGSRQYKLQNLRFGKQAAVDVRMSYRQSQGAHYTVVARSGSDTLNCIIDKVIAQEKLANSPQENARHQLTPANYRVRLVGSEVINGSTCYVLELTPKVKDKLLIAGKAWIDTASYNVVRTDGRFGSMSVLVGAPHVTEEFTEVHGFWMASHVRSISSSVLLGQNELNIYFSGYQFDQDSASTWMHVPVPQPFGL